MYEATLEHVLTAEVLNKLQPRSLSNLVYAIAAAPAAVAAAYAPALANKVLPVLLQQHTLEACNAQVGSHLDAV